MSSLQKCTQTVNEDLGSTDEGYHEVVDFFGSRSVELTSPKPRTKLLDLPRSAASCSNGLAPSLALTVDCARVERQPAYAGRSMSK